jgi:hypothetical protein
MIRDVTIPCAISRRLSGTATSRRNW